MVNCWSYREKRQIKVYFKMLNLELGQEPHPGGREVTWTGCFAGITRSQVKDPGNACSSGHLWEISFSVFSNCSEDFYLLQEVIETAHLLVCMLFPLKTTDRGKGKAQTCIPCVAECRKSQEPYELCSYLVSILKTKRLRFFN